MEHRRIALLCRPSFKGLTYFEKGEGEEMESGPGIFKGGALPLSKNGRMLLCVSLSVGPTVSRPSGCLLPLQRPLLRALAGEMS